MKPEIGRHVHYHDPARQKEPFAAIVAAVLGEGQYEALNLTVLAPDGTTFPALGVEPGDPTKSSQPCWTAP